MKKQTLNFFVCPKCDQELVANSIHESRDRIMIGFLYCKKCSKEFPIINGILRCVHSSDITAGGWSVEWKHHSKTRIDKFTGHNFMRKRFYESTCWRDNLDGQVILEAGCGAGSHTQIVLESKAEVFSFDYSGSVDVVKENLGFPTNLNLFQADIYKLPLKKEMFDKIFCLGIVQHTPNPKKAFMSLVPLLKPGGEIVIDCYRLDWKVFLQFHYYIRPFIKRMDRERLYYMIKRIVRRWIPLTSFLRKFIGSKATFVLIPICDWGYLPISKELNIDWSIQSTYDIYSAIHTHPQTIRRVRRWFLEAGLTQVQVHKGFNGIVGRAKKPS